MPNTLPSFIGQALTLYERQCIVPEGPGCMLLLLLKENKAFFNTNINTQNNVVEIMCSGTLKHRECESQIVNW